MKTVADLKLVPLWVNPDHQVASARFMMAGHRVRCLGVLEGTQFVGTLSYRDLAGMGDNAPIRDVMVPVGSTVQVSQSLRSVAQVMTLEDLDYIPVVSEGKFLGMVTATMLLSELSRTYDPMTGLSWSDRLREWGVEQLKTGDDVTIIFVDLDDFGQYNKRYGHIVGDRVLQRVAKYLREVVQDATDILVRYGGDEFVIGTTRPRRDAEQLVELIQHRVAGTFIGESEQPITISVGIFGGRRTHERESIHFAATLDSLINLASKDCMAQKAKKLASRTIAEPTPLIEGHAAVPESIQKQTAVTALESSTTDFTVSEVYADDRESRSVTMVTLAHEGNSVRGIHARTGNATTLESVVRATANALERSISGLTVTLESVTLTEDSEPASIQIAGSVKQNGHDQVLLARRVVGDDLYVSAADCALHVILEALKSETSTAE